MISNETNTTNNLDHILGGLNITMAGVGAIPTQFLGPKGEIPSAIINVIQNTISSGIGYADSDFSPSQLEEIAALALTGIFITEGLLILGIAAVPAAITAADDKIYDFYIQIQESFFQDIAEAMNSSVSETNDNHTTTPSSNDISDWMDQNDPFAEPTATQDTIDIPIWEAYDPLVLDLNGDGVIDSNDDVYAQLQVWKDTNGDGLSSAGELLSMQEAGVASMNLSHTDTEVDNSGNIVTQVVVNNLEYTGKRDVS